MDQPPLFFIHPFFPVVDSIGESQLKVITTTCTKSQLFSEAYSLPFNTWNNSYVRARSNARLFAVHPYTKEEVWLSRCNSITVFLTIHRGESGLKGM